MHFRESLRDQLSEQHGPALRRAQLAAFNKQIPLLYFVVCVNALTVSYTNYGIAPDYLTVLFPAVFVAFAVARTVIWMTARPKELDDKTVSRLLGRLYTIGLTLGVFVVVWAVLMHFHGTVETRGHVIIAVGITVFTGTFFLMHVRTAAVLLTIIVIVPFCVYLMLSPSPYEHSVAVNLALVAIAMIAILFIVSNDFEKMVRKELETQHLANENAMLAAQDSLTGLPNRRNFFATLDRFLSDGANRMGTLAVGVVDLDGFKPINDLYGHVVGDEVLVQVADRLRTVTSGKALVARLGGDEFGIIFADCPGADSIMRLSDAVCAELQAPFVTMNAVANISASVGFSILDRADCPAMTLYERADFALYHAKDGNRGGTVIFSESHESELRRHGLIEQTLRSADLEAEMNVVFQPLFDTSRNVPVAFEALARWHSPQLGLVSPGDFIPVAERSELICKLTSILLRKALATACQWPERIGITFNLSVRDLVTPASILQIISIVNASGVNPHRIDFEVTESALLVDFEQAQDSIRALKALGAKISLDDFGTGYSSLSYVHKLPLDKIKIDRSFVTEIETALACRNIVKTVVGLCRDLGIECVVEGMETAEQARILGELGCHSMQGYYFGGPMDCQKVLSIISEAPADARKIA